MSESHTKPVEMVNIKIDGNQIQVPKGTNLIDAARQAGVEIPHYCYHPHLSVAGNCRMCQVEIEGQPKLAIGCNTTAAEGLSVKTHFTSEAVEKSQKATLEFLLINHPLDCTVCDQAGHCKLQDYHYEYNGQGSRFIEDKVHKVKAEVLGPEVIYDGERCIMCTRCVRFCDEVTKTSELAGYNRGDRGVISVFPGKELNNALSGTVVDLCPVGALTHRRWRFNTRMWYTSQVDTICAGCSTGCNVRAATRDEQVVHVKARLNSDVNKEWLCDEGRYGFGRFQPQSRLTGPIARSANDSAKSDAHCDSSTKSSSTKSSSTKKEGCCGGVCHGFAALEAKAAVTSATKLAGSGDDVAVFISPLLTTEEIWVALSFAEKVMGASWSSGRVALAIKHRELSEVEKVLVSPDYAPNARALDALGVLAATDWRAALEQRYSELLGKLKQGSCQRVLLVGDGAILAGDVDEQICSAIKSAALSVAIATNTPSSAKHIGACQIVLPGRTVNEKSGVFINKDLRVQRLRPLLTAPFGSQTEWMWLAQIAAAAGKPVVTAGAVDDRALFREMTEKVAAFGGKTLQAIGDAGSALNGVA